MFFFYAILILLETLQLKAAPTLSQIWEICTTEWALTSSGLVPTVTRAEVLTYTNIVVETAAAATITRTSDVTTVTVSLDKTSVVTVPVTIFDAITQIESRITTVTDTTTVYQGSLQEHLSAVSRTILETVQLATPSGFRRPRVGLLQKREFPADFLKKGAINERFDRLLNFFNRLGAWIWKHSSALVTRDTKRMLHKRVPYPTKVVCIQLTTVTVASTRTMTRTSAETIDASAMTHTVYRTGLDERTFVQADGLVSVMLTVTEVTVATAVVTETTTVMDLPTVTEYAACLPSNRLDNVRGEPIGRVWEGPKLYETVEFADAQTPYDCCATCLGTLNCGGTSFKPLPDKEGGTCMGLITLDDCDLGNLVGFFDSSPGSLADKPTEFGIHVSSGYCGYVEYDDFDRHSG